jgi:hypothetical protein
MTGDRVDAAKDPNRSSPLRPGLSVRRIAGASFIQTFLRRQRLLTRQGQAQTGPEQEVIEETIEELEEDDEGDPGRGTAQAPAEIASS